MGTSSALAGVLIFAVCSEMEKRQNRNGGFLNRPFFMKYQRTGLHGNFNENDLHGCFKVSLWYKKMLSTSLNPHIVFHFLLSGGRVETEAWTEEQTYREEDTGSTLGRFWNLSLFFFFVLILAPSVDPREEPRLLRYERAPRPPRHKGSENQRASEKGSTKRFFKLFFDVTVSSIDLEILFSKRTLTCKRFELFP